MSKIKTVEEANAMIDNLIEEGYKNTFDINVDDIKQTIKNIFSTDYRELLYTDEVHIVVDSNKKTFSVMPRRIPRLMRNFGGTEPYKK